MPELVIIRGLPGSGKSTYAKAQFPHHKHFEADMFFVRDGKYRFDFTKLNEAHDWCVGETARALYNGHDVVVTNTFIQTWEFDSYMSAVSDIEFDTGAEISIRVVEMKTQYQNIHGVPEDKLQKMRNRWHSWDTVKEDLGVSDIIYEVVE